MQVLIKDPNGKTIVIDSEPSETILSLKNKIKNKENIPINIIRLINSNFLTLEDTKTLEYYNILNYSILQMKLKSIPNLNYINIKTSDGKKFIVRCNLSDTIKVIKSKIYKKKKIPTESQILFFNNNKLKDDEVLGNIIENQDIFLYLENNIEKEININVFIENLSKSIPINFKIYDKIEKIKDKIK